MRTTPSKTSIAALALLAAVVNPVAPVRGLQTAAALANYSKDAISLFNNMRTPAALLSGGLVPLGIMTAPVIQKDDSRATKVLKKTGALLGVASLLSEIMAVTYSSIAINKLVELPSPNTASVADLISQNHEMSWLGTNIHFLLGMMGFGLLVGIRIYLMFGSLVGNLAVGLSAAFFLQSLAVVNRGIAMGGVGETTPQFAPNFGLLCLRYVAAVFRNAAAKGPRSTGVCGALALVVSVATLALTARSFWRDAVDAE